VGDWSDYFEDFPEENPANHVDGFFDCNQSLQRPVAHWPSATRGRASPSQRRTGSNLKRSVFAQATLVRSRKAAFLAQRGLCYYCSCRMDPPGDSSTSNRHRECTAEHLQARQDGGTDQRANVVAACWYCNHTRHARYGGCSPSDFRSLVKKKIRAGRWPTVASSIRSEA
jgi:hypothetical protein